MKSFKFIEDSVVSKGYSRSIIIDFTRNKFVFIPNSLADIIERFDKGSKSEVINYYGAEHTDIIEEYFNFLEREEFIFYPNKEVINCFKKIEFDFHYPSQITNCIYDLSLKNQNYLQKSVIELQALGCKAIQIRTLHDYSFREWDLFLGYFQCTIFTSIEIICKNSTSFLNIQWQDLINKYNRVKSVVVYNSNNTGFISKDNSCHQVVFETSESLPELYKCCGNISRHYFNVNISLYSESQSFNTCLNKKISIDSEGNIRNCPSINKVVGSVFDSGISSIVMNNDFIRLWGIKKDSIKVCKDCEFRHICTDCRAFLEDPDDIYSKPLKCGYNPYTNEWEQWSTHLLKQKAIEFYGLKEIIT